MGSYKAYLTSDFEPTTKDKATLIKIVEDSGRVIFIHPNKSAAPNANTQKADVHAWYMIADDPPAAIDPQAQHALFATLIAKWQVILMLDEWEITFAVRDVPRVNQGVVVSFTEKKAAIDLSSRNTAETAEEDIAHEMLHLLLYNENWSYDAFADDMVTRKAISKDEYVALQESFNLSQNITIEHTKRIFAKAGIWSVAQRNEFEKIVEGDDFWKMVYPEGLTAEQVSNELYDYRQLLDGLPKLYDHITGGAISKPNTDKAAIRAVHDDYVTRQIETAVAEEREACARAVENFMLGYAGKDSPESDHKIIVSILRMRGNK